MDDDTLGGIAVEALLSKNSVEVMPNKKTIPRVCRECGVDFLAQKGNVDRGFGKYCTPRCKAIAHGAENPDGSGLTKTSRIHRYILQRAKDHPRAVNGYVPQHILIAEGALGRFLPKGAEIHHADQDRKNNANRNLVICQDRGYHLALHARLRVVAAGGSPDTHKICQKCRNLLVREVDFSRYWKSYDGRATKCRCCCAEDKKRKGRKVV